MINAQIRDDECLSLVLNKMMGKMILAEGTTEHDEMELYKQSDHINYFIPSGDGFLCVTEYDHHVFIPFAWYDGSFSAHKDMVKLGKELYKYYTINKDKKIYYSGIKNFYGHNSVEVSESIWIFRPKHIV